MITDSRGKEEGLLWSLAVVVTVALVPHALKGFVASGGEHHGGGMAMTFHVSATDPLWVDALAPYDTLSYAAVLAVVAALGAAKEWLFARRLADERGGSTAEYGAQLALANLVMLAVMSYEAGYTIAAIGGSMAGHRAFAARRPPPAVAADSCCE